MFVPNFGHEQQCIKKLLLNKVYEFLKCPNGQICLISFLFLNFDDKSQIFFKINPINSKHSFPTKNFPPSISTTVANQGTCPRENPLICMLPPHILPLNLIKKPPKPGLRMQIDTLTSQSIFPHPSSCRQLETNTEQSEKWRAFRFERGFAPPPPFLLLPATTKVVIKSTLFALESPLKSHCCCSHTVALWAGWFRAVVVFVATCVRSFPRFFFFSHQVWVAGKGCE